VHISAVLFNSLESFIILSRTSNLDSMQDAVHRILHRGRKKLAVHVWKRHHKLVIQVAMTPTEQPRILDLFMGSDHDAERADMLSLLVRDSKLAQVIKKAKNQVVRSSCWNVHEKLFTKIVGTFGISDKDIDGGKGTYCYIFANLLINNPVSLPGHSSALWIACYKGSEIIVKQIIDLYKDRIKDYPSMDGTTGFMMALSKNKKTIVDMFLEKHKARGHKTQGYCFCNESCILNSAAKKAREKCSKKQDQW
jgi:hypothetical protein